MDPLMLGIVVVVGLVAIVWYFNRDSESLDINEDGKVNAEDAVAAVEKAKTGVKKEVKKAVAEVKSAVVKLPNKTALNKMTKKQIDETAADLGIKLDARKSKADMIKSFQAEAKKLK